MPGLFALKKISNFLKKTIDNTPQKVYYMIAAGEKLLNKNQEGKTMKGTEKQIAWAQEIQRKAVSALNWGIETFADKPAFVEKCKQVKAAIEAVEYAGDLIAVYKNVNDSSDEKNMRMISAIVCNRFGTSYDNPAQYALIGK